MHIESRATRGVKKLWQLLNHISRRDGNGQIGSRHLVSNEPLGMRSRFEPPQGRLDLAFKSLYPHGILCARTATGELYGTLVDLLGKTHADRLDTKHVAAKRIIGRCETAVRRRNALQVFDDCSAVVKMIAFGQDERRDLSERINGEHVVEILEGGKDTPLERHAVMVERNGDATNEW